MATESRGCIFCGASRLTKTHLIAQRSIRRHLPSSGLSLYREDVWLDAGGQPKKRQLSHHNDPLGQQVKRACEPCNRDWMGGIEIAAAPWLIALAKREQVTLDEVAAKDIALWAATVTVLRATQDPGKSHFGTSDAKHLRETNSLPSGFVVWLVAGETRWDFASRHMRLIPALGESHLTWFYLGAAVFVVTHPALAEHLAVLNLLGDAVNVLAPYGDYPIEWPQRQEVPLKTMIEVTSLIRR